MPIIQLYQNQDRKFLNNRTKKSHGEKKCDRKIGSSRSYLNCYCQKTNPYGEVKMTPAFRFGNEKNVYTARRKRLRRRGRLIHSPNDSFITNRILDQLIDEVMYQEAFREKSIFER